ncbi:MAG: LysM peptidoglycan-binding domain-containing protein [Bdellovibrio sp.]|nr:LysM peptidoglycan-binding domain-containing protein [Bdellovibrio sp.]
MKIIPFFILFISITALASKPPVPEEETKKIAHFLKAISNEEWKTIASDKISYNYEILKGDTLWDISKKLFGDPRYWPKIWALNNKLITNPHRINPKNLIAFTLGSGVSLPQVALKEAQTLDNKTAQLENQTAENIVQLSHGTSTEWKILPQQNWEVVPAQLSQYVDADGFDRRNKISFQVHTGFELLAIPSHETIESLGTIIAATTPAAFLGLTDTVFIESDKKLNKGEVYAITEKPTTLSTKQSDRKGYSYHILAKVEIAGFQDDLYIGKLLNGYSPIKRNNFIIPLPPKAKNITPIPAPETLEAALILDKDLMTTVAAQHKQVFIDRGSTDGIKQGMVFRSYQHRDPLTLNFITNENFIINADILVVYVSEEYSAGLVIKSINPIYQDAPLILLTDVSDILKNKGILEKALGTGAIPAPATQDIDDLDNLDDGNELSDKEKRELKQLEKWKNNPPEDTLKQEPIPPAPPTAEPPPDDTQSLEEPEETTKTEEPTKEEEKKSPEPPANDAQSLDDESLPPPEPPPPAE